MTNFRAEFFFRAELSFQAENKRSQDELSRVENPSARLGFITNIYLGQVLEQHGGHPH